MTHSLSISPVIHPLQARVRVPGSKSLTNRALSIAALADGETTLTEALFSDDSQYFAAALTRLGFSVVLDPSAARMTVGGGGGRLPSARADLFVGNAGTAARFLTALLTLGHGEYTLDGDERMRQRPIGDLVEALRQLGANITPLMQETVQPAALCPPLRILASGLPGGSAAVAGNLSSQYLSALLMAAPYAQKPVDLTILHGLSSKPYVEMTLAVMADFGVTVERDGCERFFIPSQRYRSPGQYAIESDASAASYFFAAPAVCGGVLRVENITRRSRQGDIAFLDILAQMGCTVTEGDSWIEVAAPSSLGTPPVLRGVEVDLGDIPDTAQTLAAIAPFASTPTHIYGIASARLKETDRIAGMAAELSRLGVSVTEHSDGLTIQPCAAIRPALVQTYNDHRMAMAFSLLGLRAPGVSIENPACVSKTFPRFFDVLGMLYGG